MGLSSGFNFLINKQGREITYLDFENDLSYKIKMAQSNYNRDFSASEEVTFPGREYVVSVDNLKKGGYTRAPQKNHRITDIDLGERTIEEVREMIVFGKITGYRIRTN